MSDDLVNRFRMLQGALDHGCSDGGCVIEVTKGQHTNGGCKCLYHPTHFTLNRVGHMLRCAQDMADRIEELEAKLAKAVEAAVDTCASLAAAISLLENGGKKAAPSNKMFSQMLVDYQASLDRARTTIAELKGDKP